HVGFGFHGFTNRGERFPRNISRFETLNVALHEKQSAILPLPFGRGVGWGEGSVLLCRFMGSGLGLCRRQRTNPSEASQRRPKSDDRIFFHALFLRATEVNCLTEESAG